MFVNISRNRNDFFFRENAQVSFLGSNFLYFLLIFFQVRPWRRFHDLNMYASWKKLHFLTQKVALKWTSQCVKLRKSFTWNCIVADCLQSQNLSFVSVFDILNLPKLISRKIWVIEKFLIFHTVNLNLSSYKALFFRVKWNMQCFQLCILLVSTFDFYFSALIFFFV